MKDFLVELAVEQHVEFGTKTDETTLHMAGDTEEEIHESAVAGLEALSTVKEATALRSWRDDEDESGERTTYGSLDRTPENPIVRGDLIFYRGMQNTYGAVEEVTENGYELDNGVTITEDGIINFFPEMGHEAEERREAIR